MQTNVKKLSIPRRLPGYLEVKHDKFKNADEATVAEWRLAKENEPDGRRRRAIARMIKIADLLGIADAAPLLPRLLNLYN